MKLSLGHTGRDKRESFYSFKLFSFKISCKGFDSAYNILKLVKSKMLLGKYVILLELILNYSILTSPLM
jgi:hypothetical protein